MPAITTETTPKLNLPLIAAQQAQKHVTHNEALRALDALVQATVKDRDLAAPPASAQEGDCYIVATGASGDWAGQENAIAEFRNGGWVFHAPAEGWLAFVQDENAFLFFDGSTWQNLTAAITALQNLLKLGINTTADDTNRLAVKSDAVLFSHDDVTPGTGDVRFKVNKASAANTASLLFQDNWSGRAEIGLAGSDNFSLKVSADGIVWRDSIIADSTTGRVSFPSGGVREQLSASRTYYVDAANGNDANDGLTATQPFATIQRAVDAVASLDISIHNVTVIVADGIYNEQVMLKDPQGYGYVTLLGNAASPSSVVIDSTGYSMLVPGVRRWIVRGFRIQAAKHGMDIYDGALITLREMDFGFCAWSHLNVRENARLYMPSSYLVSDGASSHFNVRNGGLIILQGAVYTLSGTPHFSVSFANAETLGLLRTRGSSFAGTATGMRYRVFSNAIIDTGGAGTDHFPGDAAGITGSGGIYS